MLILTKQDTIQVNMKKKKNLLFFGLNAF